MEQVSQERQARRLQVEVKQVEEVDEVEASRAAPPTRDKAVAATPLITTWTTTVALITFPTNQAKVSFAFNTGLSMKRPCSLGQRPGMVRQGLFLWNTEICLII